MEDEKQGDIRIPLVFTVFCLCVIAGGIFLVFYVFFPHISEPWYPTAALILIGLPWIFWLLTYLYTCMKRYCVYAPVVDHQMSRSSNSRNASSREPEMPLTHSV